jgi:hypothetical protein
MVALVKEAAKNAWTKQRVAEVALMIGVQVAYMAVLINLLHMDVIVSAFIAASFALCVVFLYQRSRERKRRRVLETRDFL